MIFAGKDSFGVQGDSPTLSRSLNLQCGLQTTVDFQLESPTNSPQFEYPSADNNEIYVSLFFSFPHIALER